MEYSYSRYYSAHHLQLHINLPLHDNQEAFLTLVGVLKHVSNVDNVNTPEEVNCSFWGEKNKYKF